MKTATLTKKSRKFVEDLIARPIATQDAEDVAFLERVEDIDKLIESIAARREKLQDAFDCLTLAVADGSSDKAHWRRFKNSLKALVDDVGALNATIGSCPPSKTRAA